MRFNYSALRKFPELIVPAIIASPAGGQFFDADAKLDTGADVTIIPEAICKSLKLVPFNYVAGSGARGERWESIQIFAVQIRVAAFAWLDVEVVTSPNNYILLGRDILNRCILHADGPAGFFELTLPAKKS